MTDYKVGMGGVRVPLDVLDDTPARTERVKAIVALSVQDGVTKPDIYLLACIYTQLQDLIDIIKEKL